MGKKKNLEIGAIQLLTDDVVQPVVLLIPCLEHQPQMQIPIRLLRAGRLDEDVGTVVRLQVVPRVGGEEARLGVARAPVGAEIEDPAVQARAREVAADDGDGGAQALGRLAGEDARLAVDERRVQVLERWRGGRGGAGTGGACGEEERAGGEHAPEQLHRGGCYWDVRSIQGKSCVRREKRLKTVIYWHAVRLDQWRGEQVPVPGCTAVPLASHVLRGKTAKKPQCRSGKGMAQLVSALFLRNRPLRNAFEEIQIQIRDPRSDGIAG